MQRSRRPDDAVDAAPARVRPCPNLLRLPRPGHCRTTDDGAIRQSVARRSARPAAVTQRILSLTCSHRGLAGHSGVNMSVPTRFRRPGRRLTTLATALLLVGSSLAVDGNALAATPGSASAPTVAAKAGGAGAGAAKGGGV